MDLNTDLSDKLTACERALDETVRDRDQIKKTLGLKIAQLE